MDFRKELLLQSSARLYSIGIDLEAARERLRALVAEGVSFDSDEMLEAYQAFCELDQRWKSLERQHTELRDELLAEGKTEEN